MKKRMIPLLLLLSSHFLLAVYGRDSQKEQSRVVVIAIDGLRWQEVFELIGHTSDIKSAHPGQARCPCWASTLPQVGTDTARNVPKTFTERNRRKGMQWLHGLMILP